MRRRRMPRRPQAANGKFTLVLLMAASLFFLFSCSVYLRKISTQIAVSDASDVVTMHVNRVIAEIMSEGSYDADYFVSFEKRENGEVSAISCNMARINALSALILDRVVGATDEYMTTVRIPIGNLTGVNLLMGRGPKVPVEIVTLTSSRVEFNNQIVTAGINQTKHQIALLLKVDIDILVPWGSESTQVQSEVLIADTVVVGQVPETYLDMNGSARE